MPSSAKADTTPVATVRNSLNQFPRLLPQPVRAKASVTDVVDSTFLAYNAARLREGCQLFVRKMLARHGLVGVSLTGALTPGGLGAACIIPLIRAGFIDWIVSTGANVYHDLHFALGMRLHRGSPFLDDRELRRKQIIRIYDVLFDYRVLLDTDEFICRVIAQPEFQRTMATDELHYRLGRYVRERERALGLKDASLLAVAYECGVPIFTSSPGDSSLGMNIAGLSLRGNKLQFDVNRDVNQTAAIVFAAKRAKLTSSVLIFGGGSPKNFMLQTEPQIQEVLGLAEKGHDYFLQITDARPDTGGLSGATPSEAVSWGKVDPDKLPDSVVCYLDSTVALPLFTAYALARAKRRKLKRLYDRRDKILDVLRQEYLKGTMHQHLLQAYRPPGTVGRRGGRSGRSVGAAF